jgi:SNF2 family DNA or RNA helicase
MNAETPITFVTNDGQHVVVPYHEGLAGLVPGAMPFDWQGSRMLVMPNGASEAKLARNLGLPVPSPILTRYDWCHTKPWDIQKITAALLAEATRCYVLSSMGTGKTRSVLYAIDYLFRNRQAKRALIVAPLSTLTPVWETEAFNLMFRHRVSVLYGSRAKRLDLLNAGTPFCIINHHGLRVIGPEVAKAGFDIVVFDELAVYRNRSTELWKSAANVVNADSVKYAWGLTGSPTPNAPTDAWAQVRLLTPVRAPRSMVAFRDQTMRQITQFKWVPRPEANSIVHRAMSPSVRYTREDVMELPECITVDRAVSLDEDARKAYTMLWDKARVITQQGDSITAVNEAVLQGKLLQVATGFIYTDKHTVYALPVTGRLKALADTLDETDHKSLVFVPFLHALHGVSNYLRSKGYDVATVHGGTSRGVRDKLFADFQRKPSPHIIVAHPQCLSHGLTLTAADTIVWYSPTTSLETYEQANARINRPGQINRMLIAHLVGTPVEKATYARLRAKARQQGCLLDLFKQQALAF